MKKFLSRTSQVIDFYGSVWQLLILNQFFIKFCSSNNTAPYDTLECFFVLVLPLRPEFIIGGSISSVTEVSSHRSRVSMTPVVAVLNLAAIGSADNRMTAWQCWTSYAILMCALKANWSSHSVWALGTIAALEKSCESQVGCTCSWQRRRRVFMSERRNLLLS